MSKQLKAMNEYRKASMSLANMKARAFRIAGTCVAYMVGTGQITREMNWESFISDFSSPIHVIGMLGVILVAGSTAGGSK